MRHKGFIAVLVVAAVGLFWAWSKHQAVRSEAVPIAPEVPTNAAVTKLRLARPMHLQPIEPAAITNQFRGWLTNADSLPVLTDDQVEGYLAANHRNAASLLGAFRATHDKKFLDEAKQNFPNDPHVDFAAVFENGISPEEKHDWLEKWKQNDAGNALPNYIAAGDAFKAGDNALGIQEMTAAANKPGWQNYLEDYVQGTEEAYLGAGMSELDAKVAASNGALLPELAPIKQLGKSLGALASSYQNAGDTASAQATWQAAMNLGEQFANINQQPVITSLVGLAVENIALSGMDPNATFGDSGQTVQAQLDQIAAQKKAIAALGRQEDPVLAAMPDSDVSVYYDRIKVFGPLPALQWAVNKYGGQ